MTIDNFCFYLQNRLIQTSQTGGQQYSDTSPLVFPDLYNSGRRCQWNDIKHTATQLDDTRHCDILPNQISIIQIAFNNSKTCFLVLDWPSGTSFTDQDWPQVWHLPLHSAKQARSSSTHSQRTLRRTLRQQLPKSKATIFIRLFSSSLIAWKNKTVFATSKYFQLI